MFEMQQLPVGSLGAMLGAPAGRAPAEIRKREGADDLRQPELNAGKRKPSGVDTASRADKAVKSFNTWSFKREQPSGADLLSALQYSNGHE